MDFDRHVAEIVHQTDLLRSHVKGADVHAPVPSCPGWNLSQLLRHVGGTLRWAETVVRTRATGPVPHDLVDDVAPYADEDPAELDAWVAGGAAGLAKALRDSGPDAAVWTPADDGAATRFWARRQMNEVALHRYDAAFAVGADYTLAEDVALDALDEWMAAVESPEAYAAAPGRPGLLGPGRTVHLHATDASPGSGEWLVDLTGEEPVRRHAHEKAAVAVRGPLTDLLLFVYRRPSLGSRVEVFGDEDLLELWRNRTGFWLESE